MSNRTSKNPYIELTFMDKQRVLNIFLENDGSYWSFVIRLLLAIGLLFIVYFLVTTILYQVLDIDIAIKLVQICVDALFNLRECVE